MVRGKFRLESETKHASYPGVELKFRAVTNDETAENKRFHQYTPAGEITMTVDNPAAQQQFEVGQEYYVDFSPVA